MLTTGDLDELASEPTIRSCVSGQRILFFDSCQFTIIWMSIIKLNTSYRLPHQQKSLTFHIGFPVVRTDGRTVTWLPKYLGWIDYQIFLGMGLRSRTLRARVAPLQRMISKDKQILSQYLMKLWKIKWWPYNHQVKGTVSRPSGLFSL